MARFALLVLACATGGAYLVWRVSAFNPDALAFSWIVYAAEVVGFARLLLALATMLRVTQRESPAVAPNLAVDVFVTTIDEPLDVVRRTLLAAVAMRYPHETWLLDDGDRPAMRDLADDVGARYVARPGDADGKAGNLNHALTIARGAYVAIFDADHVADARFLDRTLGYFSDERIGFVQTPHEFFNADSFEHLVRTRTESNGQSFFHRIIQHSRDVSGSTILSGSAAVLRRAALDAIGGFATGTVTEDVQTSFRLHAAGWTSVFHADVLSAGIAPLDAAASFGQRLRWAQGAVQLALRENIAGCAGLSARQRVAYALHVAGNLEGWRHLVIYALPIAILLTGVVPVQTTAATFAVHYLPYLLASLLASSALTSGHHRFYESAVYNIARCPASIIATFTGMRTLRFRVTPKTRRSHSERSATAFPAVLALLTLGAVAVAAGRALTAGSPRPADALIVVSAWALFHVVTAAHLLLHARRCAGDRRAVSRFRCHVPASIASLADPHARYAVDLVEAGADGFSFKRRDGGPAPAAGAYSGTLELAGETFAFTVVAHRARDGRIGGAVRWNDDATRARFDLALHGNAIPGLFERADDARKFAPKEPVVLLEPRSRAIG